MEQVIKVLDHGYVKLIDSMGKDEDIISAARMSTNKGFEGWEKDEKLLEFLWENRHTSPFEMCELAIEVQAPLFVIREWQRHRTQSYNELSARYTQMPDLHYVPAGDRFTPKVTGNKQESGFTSKFVMTEEAARMNVEEEQKEIYKTYEDLLNAGVPKEVARVNTPVSRYSRMRTKTDLLNWLKFLDSRMRPNAQYEIREYANAVAEIIKGIWPKTYALFEEHNLNAVTLSNAEWVAIRDELLNLNQNLLADKLTNRLGERRKTKLFAKLRLV